jgi:hypothetical protein
MEYSDGHCAAFHVFDNNSVGADFCAVTDDDGSENLGTGANIDIIANHGQSAAMAGTNCNLLKYKAIESNSGCGMDHDSVRVRDQKATTDLAVERNVSRCHDAPKAMAKDDPFLKDSGKDAGSLLPTLVGANAQQQLATGVPKLARCFPCPIGDFNDRIIIHR